MSFGFGIGDFLTVLKLASEVRQKWSDAPAEYATARNEIKRLEGILGDLSDLSERVDIPESLKDILHGTIADCKTVLVAANKIVDNYSTSSKNRLRRSWKRFTADPDDVRHIRDQLVSVVTQLNVVQGNIQIELDRDILEDIQDLKLSHDDESKLRIANWFSTSAFAEQQTAQLNLRQAGTADWFLNHPLYKVWRGGVKQTLFCPGIAGSGKSVIFAAVVKDLQDHFEQDPDVVVTYFYCNYKRQNEQQFPQILAAFVRQLFQERASIPVPVQTAYDKHLKRGSQPSVDELISLIQALARTYIKVYMLVDALDECNSEDDFGTRGKLLSFLVDLQNQDGMNIDIMTTCRPGVVRQFDVSPQIEIRAQPEDVVRYLNANIASVVPCVVNNPLVRKQITESIADIVDGMFLLARLHLESLRDKTKVRAVLKALEALPRGSASEVLDRAYDEILDRINQQLSGFKDLARRTLTWITHARRELHLDELREGLAIEPDMTDIDPQIDLDDEQTIISVCAGLVVVDQESGVVRLAHYTAQVYLEHNHLRWLPGGGKYIATSCISYLLMQPFYTEKTKWGMDLWSYAQKHKLLHYIGKNWGFHSRELEGTPSYTNLMSCNQSFLCFASQVALGSYDPELRYYACNIRDISPLHLCAYFDDEKAMLFFLENGYDVNLTDGSKQSALHVAATYRRLRTVRQLLACPNINVNLQDREGSTPLSEAAYEGNTEIVALLLAQENIDVNIQDNYGDSPLLKAVISGHADVVAQLIERDDVNVNACDIYDDTALLKAASFGHVDVVAQLLTREDVAVNAMDRYNYTSLLKAAANGHTEIVALLLARHDILIDTEDRTALCEATYHQHPKTVALLLQHQDIDINKSDADSNTPLSNALISYDTETAAQLLSRSDINLLTKDEYGRTPLLCAAFCGDIGIFTQLLAREEISRDVNAVDDSGATALLEATAHGFTEAVAQLLARDDSEFSVNRADEDGHTPLSTAARYGYTEIVKQLLAHDSIGISLNLEDSSGVTPIIRAARHKHKEAVNLLISQPDIKLSRRDAKLVMTVGQSYAVKLMLTRPEMFTDYDLTTLRSDISRYQKGGLV